MGTTTSRSKMKDAVAAKRTIKHPTSFKLSDTALAILAELSIRRGIAKSAVVENLLREAQDKEDQRMKGIFPINRGANK